MLPPERFGHCASGKARYPGRSEARDALRGVRERARKLGSRKARQVRSAYFYRCGDCGGWHLAAGRGGKRAA